MVGERSIRAEVRRATAGGGHRSANAGMSSVNTDENSVHRKSKGSYGRFIRVGLVGPKPRPPGVGDGQQVSIPAPLTSRYQQSRDPEG